MKQKAPSWVNVYILMASINPFNLDFIRTILVFCLASESKHQKGATVALSTDKAIMLHQLVRTRTQCVFQVNKTWIITVNQTTVVCVVSPWGMTLVFLLNHCTHSICLLCRCLQNMDTRVEGFTEECLILPLMLCNFGVAVIRNWGVTVSWFPMRPVLTVFSFKCIG